MGDDLGDGGGDQQWMRTASDGTNNWAMACIVDGGGGVDIIGPNFCMARQSHNGPRIVTVLVLLLVGFVRVRYLYLNPQICKYKIFSTDILSPVEYHAYQGF